MLKFYFYDFSIYYENSGVGLSAHQGNKIAVYPNPSKGTIQVSGLLNDALLSLYTTDSKLIWEQKTTASNPTLRWNLKPGVYYLGIKSDNVHENIKILIID